LPFGGGRGFVNLAMNYDKVPELPDGPVKPASRRGLWLGGGLLLVAAGAAWWQFGREPAAPTVRQQQLAGVIAGLEARLEKLRTELAALPEDSPPAAHRALLEEAVTRQDELMRQRVPPATADGVRLSDWQAQLADFNARDLSRQSRELETAATELFRQKQTVAAVEKLREALRLQREINGGMSDRQMKSYGREAMLQQQLEELVAQPLLAEEQGILAEARAAAAGGSWTDALRLYGRARGIQQQLNTDFPRSRFSDLLADSRIETEIASLSATEALAQRDAFQQQATTAATAGKPAEADRLYALAADRQRVINTRFPQSRFVSMERLEQIEVERQTLHARPALDALRAGDGAVTGHLRRRELFQAQQQLAQAQQQLEDAVQQWPKARGFDEEMCERLNYLARRSADLVGIQDQTYDLLLPLPGRTPGALLKTGLPQALFALVMNQNPSRNPGPARPVDSVNHAEAKEFCRRLGWVLGAAVRLPTAAECRAAAGDPTFKDMAGGLGEWLAPEGGDPATAPVLIPGGTIQETPRTERSRTTGFRVVVEVDLLATR
jgi:hypothetical protein